MLTESINWYGTYSLTIHEIKRFLRVYNQTIIAPAISALIFLSVFVLALGSSAQDINGIKFINFMGYGLVIMSIVQNAFANTSSSLIMSKVIGYISDIIVVPLSGVEIVIAYLIGALVRGIVVGLCVFVCLLPFVEFTCHHPILLVFFTTFSCLLLGHLGILSGIIANGFDQNAAITSYVIGPLSFLSGTFYSVKKLPYILRILNEYNPFFYMIDGFRYSLTNHADSNILLGIIILLFSNILLFTLTSFLISRGWRIKG
ncbi:MAG: ABC transporter permease [Janthinobacterium lividum]